MTTIDRAFVIAGALSLTAAAALSAWGFHGLADVLTPEKRESWEWAVQMQSYHSLGLILAGLLAMHLGSSWALRGAGALMAVGILVFSGLIYAEALGAPEAVGEIVPMGGTCFMLAWVALAVGAWRARPAP
jgi:uncharacterized membrane protein YgdD (TMEM256/DUF423 family)